MRDTAAWTHHKGNKQQSQVLNRMCPGSVLQLQHREEEKGTDTNKKLGNVCPSPPNTSQAQTYRVEPVSGLLFLWKQGACQGKTSLPIPPQCTYLHTCTRTCTCTCTRTHLFPERYELHLPLGLGLCDIKASPVFKTTHLLHDAFARSQDGYTTSIPISFQLAFLFCRAGKFKATSLQLGFLLLQRIHHQKHHAKCGGRA